MDLEIREEKDALVKRIQTMTTEMNKLKETHRVGLEELEQANAILKEQVETLEMQIKENKRNHELDVEIREAAHQADLASKKKQLQEMCEVSLMVTCLFLCSFSVDDLQLVRYLIVELMYARHF